MKKLNLFFIAAALAAGCGGGENQSNEPGAEPSGQKEPAAVERCTYSYNPKTTGFYWTAFKHTDRAEVKGKFDSLEVAGTQTTDSPANVINHANFRIFTSSVNSNDVTRDVKIRAQYFGSMVNSSEITGSVKSVEGNNEEGNCVISLNINGAEKEITGGYTVKGDLLQVRCALNMNDWNCQKAIAALQKACAEKHTGTDGKTVFWPDVNILIETNLIKTCI